MQVNYDQYMESILKNPSFARYLNIKNIWAIDSEKDILEYVNWFNEEFGLNEVKGIGSRWDFDKYAIPATIGLMFYAAIKADCPYIIPLIVPATLLEKLLMHEINKKRSKNLVLMDEPHNIPKAIASNIQMRLGYNNHAFFLSYAIAAEWLKEKKYGENPFEYFISGDDGVVYSDLLKRGIDKEELVENIKFMRHDPKIYGFFMAYYASLFDRKTAEMIYKMAKELGLE
ncbi:MAG: hypothetical protein N3D75_03895 [Candidatus Aenigmarchaeota archaeon]|nr:hypothetical protein [Candidatus Aenigmarchaeota archaeon]